MSTQDKVEKVLRDLHVLLSKSEPVKGAPDKVAVDKQKMISLLTDLNKGIYKLMDEYELTTESRDRAEREFEKQGEDIVRGANRQAEDIYAASVMYTDESLNHVQEIMRQSSAAVQDIYNEMQRRIRDEVKTVKTNQLELRSQLQGLKDTDKYLKLIEDRNREIEREKERIEGRMTAGDRASIYANRMTEIRVNKEQLAKLGLTGGENDTEDTAELTPEKTPEAAETNPAAAAENVEPSAEKASNDKETDNSKKDTAKEVEIRVNLDADYFRWKEEQAAGKNQADKDSAAEQGSDRKKSDKKAGGKGQQMWKSFTSAWHS